MSIPLLAVSPDTTEPCLPPPSSLAVLRFSAALPMRNFDVLDAKLARISDPRNAEYGNWMTGEEVRK